MHKRAVKGCAEKSLPVKAWEKPKGRQIDNGKVKEVDERPAELREKERDRIETLMILALGDDPENELSRHCDAVMDGLMKLIACYVPPKVREEDCQGRAVHMAAVSRGDTAKRRSGLHDSSSCSQGLSLSPVGGCHA